MASAVGTVTSETTTNEGAGSGTCEVCTTEGCQLRAANPFAKCCDFYPRARSWAWLSRHTKSEQETAEQHQRRCRQRRASPTADDTANCAITNGTLLGIADSRRRAETGGRLVRPRNAVRTGRATSDSVLPVGACSAASDATRQRDRRLHQLETR